MADGKQPLKATLPDVVAQQRKVSQDVATEITLFHGDYLDVMPTLASESVAMVFADLPYKNSRSHSTDCYWDKSVCLKTFWAQVVQLCKNTTPFIFTATQPFTTSLINSNYSKFRYCLVWDKVFAGNYCQANVLPMRHHEDIVMFYHQRPTYNPQMVKRVTLIKPGKVVSQRKSSCAMWNYDPAQKDKVYTHKHPRSVQQFSSRSDKRGLHPTHKPVALLEWLIKTYTNPGDTVLDPVSGSATTAVAALRTGRNVICVEKDRAYFETGLRRVRDEVEASGVNAELVVHG